MSADRFHQAYLVRLWAVHDNKAVVWRASIENIHTGERRSFADLTSLCRFLYAAVAALAAPVPNETAPGDAPSHE